MIEIILLIQCATIDGKILFVYIVIKQNTDAMNTS